jgi:hypothetical protein
MLLLLKFRVEISGRRLVGTITWCRFLLCCFNIIVAGSVRLTTVFLTVNIAGY